MEEPHRLVLIDAGFVKALHVRGVLLVSLEGDPALASRGLLDDLDCLNYLTDRAELGPPASGFVGPHNEAADGPAAGGWAA